MVLYLGSYVLVRVTRYTRCRTSQYHKTFIPLSVSLWNDLANPVFHGVGLAGFKSRANAFLLAYAALSLLHIVFYYFSLSLISVYRLVLWGWGLRTETVYISLSAFQCRPLLIIIMTLQLTLQRL